MPLRVKILEMKQIKFCKQFCSYFERARISQLHVHYVCIICALHVYLYLLLAAVLITSCTVNCRIKVVINGTSKLNRISKYLCSFKIKEKEF